MSNTKTGNKKINSRFVSVFARNFFLTLHVNSEYKKAAKEKCKLTHDEKCLKLHHWFIRLSDEMKIERSFYGKENIPDDLQGCLFIGNHQGKMDVPLALEGISLPTTYLVDLEASKAIVFHNICDALDAAKLDRNSIREQVKTYKEMGKKIKEENYRYVVFPEAGYTDNKNTLQEFHGPCFQPALTSHCPIVPFVLYDTWRAVADDTENAVQCEIHYLKPIYYEEYQEMSREELALYLKSLIQKKLDEIIAFKQKEKEMNLATASA